MGPLAAGCGVKCNFLITPLNPAIVFAITIPNPFESCFQGLDRSVLLDRRPICPARIIRMWLVLPPFSLVASGMCNAIVGRTCLADDFVIVSQQTERGIKLWVSLWGNAFCPKQSTQPPNR